MPKRYFLCVAIFGLSVIAGILIYYISPSIISALKGEYDFIGTFRRVTAPLIAIITTILTGMYFDKKVKRPHWAATIFLIPLTIYLAGVVAGSFFNFLINGLSPFDPFSYFVKPIIIGSYGSPGALLVGVLCYAFLILMPKKTAQN